MDISIKMKCFVLRGVHAPNSQAVCLRLPAVHGSPLVGINRLFKLHKNP
jgi:hypothetical protein